jgi:hypothetical protein
MKKIFIISFLFAISVNAKEDDFRLPAGWTDKDAKMEEPSEKFTSSVDSIFQSNLEPLKMVDSEKKWGLRGFMFDLGVSAQGTLGMLVAKGASSATVVWTKKKAQIKPQAFEPAVEATTTFEGGDFRQNLEPLVQSLVKTGKVNDPVELRKNLSLLAENVEALSQGVRGLRSKNWEISRLRFDISVSTSGKVGPFVSVGGGVKVRLEWFPQSRMTPFQHSQPTAQLASVQASLSETVKELILLMESYDQSEYTEKTKLSLSAIRVGLGVSSKWKTVVLKNSASAVFYAYLSRAKPSVLSLAQSSLRGTPQGFEILDNSLSDSSRWFQLSGEPDEILMGSNPVLKIDPKKFQKGLFRATKIGGFLVSRSRKILADSSWELNQLKTGVEMNMSGDIKLVTVSGTASAEMTFKPVTN